MKYIMVTRSNAVKSSCTEGKYFVRKMIMKYGTYDDSSIYLSLKLVKQMVQEFSDYLEKTKIRSLGGATLSIHLKVFFDELLERIPRKRVDHSDAWIIEKYIAATPKQVTSDFWKELKRVAR